MTPPMTGPLLMPTRTSRWSSRNETATSGAAWWKWGSKVGGRVKLGVIPTHVQTERVGDLKRRAALFSHAIKGRPLNEMSPFPPLSNGGPSPSPPPHRDELKRQAGQHIDVVVDRHMRDWGRRGGWRGRAHIKRGRQTGTQTSED